MKLESGRKIYNEKLTIEEIKRAFADEYSLEEFLILSDDKRNFIQASGRNNQFVVEYKEGNKLYKIPTQVTSKQDIEKLFIKYFTGDLSWKNDYEWEEFQPKTIKDNLPKIVIMIVITIIIIFLTIFLRR